MNLEQQIRDAYKTTLGRDVESDSSLGYWMSQGDNWRSAFQTAASAEIAARPTNYQDEYRAGVPIFERRAR